MAVCRTSRLVCDCKNWVALKRPHRVCEVQGGTWERSVTAADGMVRAVSTAEVLQRHTLVSLASWNWASAGFS